MLLAREKTGVTDAAQRLAGLQAQWPAPPYVGFWTRLAEFERADLARALDKRTLVRAPMMRATLHVVTAGDFLKLRPVVQPVLARGFAGLGDRVKGIDPVALAAAAKPFLAETPRTQDEVRHFLVERHPKLDDRAMGHAVRMHLPLVQIPGPGTWGFPTAPQFALAEKWLGRPLAKSADPRELVRRYLAAFGPATPRDAQAWSGLPEAREAMEALRPKLKTFTDENGRELFDLPEAPRPDEDTPAPPRFMAEYDNLLLAYVDRSRVVPDKFKPKVYLAGLRVASTFLIDGFVHGSWKLERAGKKATLVVTPFAPIPRSERAALEAEAEKLLEFVAFDVDAKNRALRFKK